MEEERREHVAKMKKMELEMEQVFDMKVKEKVQKLQDSEVEVHGRGRIKSVCFPEQISERILLSLQLQKRHEQMKKNLQAQYKELEEKRRQFEEEVNTWETHQRILEQQKLELNR